MRRRRFSPKFKAKVALEAIRGLRMVNEIAQEYGVHPNQVSKWKRELIQHSPQLFSNSSTSGGLAERERERLYREIGQLQVELSWLKKKSELIS